MNLDKIIRSLDLAKSDARDKTIDGIVEYILFCINDEVSSDELNVLIKEELILELHKSELEEGLGKLIDSNAIIKGENNKYKLTTERFVQLRKVVSENDDAEKIRLENFTNSVKKFSNGVLSQEDIKLLWSTFTNYLYECYLDHGKNALNIFSGRGNYSEGEIDLKSLISKYENGLTNQNLKKIFREYIDNFSKEVTTEGLDYLLNLANKAEAFFALGLSKDEYNHIYEEITFDWTIFVDTNFLYSILDLHSHPENEAAKAVVELGRQLKIKFHYLNITLQELQNRSKDFDANIPRNLLYSQIHALVESEQIDNFSMRYFEKKLIDMENTPHPLDIVGHAVNNLKSKGIEIFRYPFEKLSDQVEYLRDRESNYNDHLKILDETRAEKGIKIKGPKDAKQIFHDVFLREAIIFLRESTGNTINDVKYLGVTLDKRLIKYDNYLIMKRKDGIHIPNFFSPSILLKKLLKYSPVKSDDYRRAFVKTISTPALDNNYHTSKVTIRSVKYFYNMGISDEKLILSAIKDEIFLSKFKEFESDAEILKEFVEAEIQKKYSQLSDTLGDVEGKLNRSNELLTAMSDKYEFDSVRTKKLEAEVNELHGTVKVYNMLGNIKKREKTPNFSKLTEGQLTIDGALKLSNAEKILSEVKQGNRNLINQIETIDTLNKVTSWRRKSLWYLIPVFIVILHVFLVLFCQKENWNYVSSLMDGWFEKLTDGRKDLVKGIVSAVLLVCIIKPVSIIWKRFFSDEEKDKFLKDKYSK
ncbi:MAG: hypothetical protein JWQ34_2916 [Mucilaginibacter sp.]|uniref:hypothetical protein n=1 Tax=Mucilaginibacter sp. TaxID=1882438 RepID=UPI0026155A57|nr:hypothetical protein [Mucilaginibacter sp.]MDB5004691.1 hypothetical protein [Mucilaginibacter sp.]